MRSAAALLPALLLLAGCGTPCAAIDRRELFTRADRPVHPLLIREFLPWLSDGGAITVAVDPLMAEGTDQYHEPYRVLSNGHVRASKADEPDGWFSYQYRGTMAGGVHVLETHDNGGGSGIFGDLLFVRFVERRVTDLNHPPQAPRLILELLAHFAMGDRASRSVRVLSDRVVVGPSAEHPDEAVLRVPPLD